MIRQRFSTIILVLLLLVSGFSGLISGEENPPVDIGSGVFENSGDWLIENGNVIEHENKTLIINGDLIINGSLSLIGCELIMNQTGSRILVNESLYLENTTITGNEVYYSFEVFGELTAIRSTFHDMSGSQETPFLGGLQVYSEQVHIEDSTITENQFTGLYLTTNITIQNCTITENVVNLVVDGSSPTFIESTIKHPQSINIYLRQNATPRFLDCDQYGEQRFEDEVSSVSICHLLSITVLFENGTGVPETMVWISSNKGDIRTPYITNEEGWINDIILPEFTYFKSHSDIIYSPYTINASNFGISVESSFDFKTSRTIVLTLTGGHFGQALTSGDFNGDGLTDLAVGAPKTTTDTGITGAVYIFINQGCLELCGVSPQNATIVLTGIVDSGFGSTLASGDIDGDGYDDLMVGSPYGDGNGTDAGMVSFFFGDPSVDWSSDTPLFIMDGAPGSSYGSQLLVAEFNGDAYEDFMIGDTTGSYLFLGSSEPHRDYGGTGSLTLFSSAIGSLDTTGRAVFRIQQDDDIRTEVTHSSKGRDELHVKNFTLDYSVGDITSAVLYVQFTTDRFYAYHNQEQGHVSIRVGENGSWIDTIQPVYDPMDWEREQRVSFDILSEGIDTDGDITSLEVYFNNIHGSQGGMYECSIYFDLIQLNITHELIGPIGHYGPGSLFTADVNGDGFKDILISNGPDQTIHFGRPGGVSPGSLYTRTMSTGSHNNTRMTNNTIELARLGDHQNADFDLGWIGWTKKNNVRNKNDGQWEITTETHGDWLVHDGPTASLGPRSMDHVASHQSESKQSDGKLVSQSFTVPDDATELEFWHHAKWWSFESTSGDEYQDTIEDAVSIRLVYSSNDTIIQSRVYNEKDWGSSGEEQGYLSFDVSDLSGKSVKLEMEIVTNFYYYDDALVQIDSIHFLPAQYQSSGSFISDWIHFQDNVTHFTPFWNQELNGGELMVNVRHSEADDWSTSLQVGSGMLVNLTESITDFQYRVEMTLEGTKTPEFKDFSLEYRLEGQILPLVIEAPYHAMKASDLDGDGCSDILLLHDEGLDILHGDKNISNEFDPSSISPYLLDNIDDFSFLDLENDGIDELAVVDSTLAILNSSKSIIWEREAEAMNIEANIAGDPSYHMNTGKIHFLPASDRDIRVLGSDIGTHVTPGDPINFNITLGNLGIHDQSGVSLNITISSDGYLYTDGTNVSISSFSMKQVSFSWDVPLTEGVKYTITVELQLLDDRNPQDNSLSFDVISRRHSISMTASSTAERAHAGDPITYTITLINTGTYPEENVTLSTQLPSGWDGEFQERGLQIETILVIDQVDVTFMIWSPETEDEGIYQFNLRASTPTSNATLDFSAEILLPDLVIIDLILLRGDGAPVNDTIHAIAGEEGVLKVKVQNTGLTYSTPTSLKIEINGELVTNLTVPQLGAGDLVWLSHDISNVEGNATILCLVDNLYVISETNESNNQLSETFHVKGPEPVADLSLFLKVVDIHGKGVPFVEVSLEWNDEDEIVVTNDTGHLAYTIHSSRYLDSTWLYINATDGLNTSHTEMRCYSQDGSITVTIILNQYFVDISGTHFPIPISMGGNHSLVLQLENKGNTNATFVIVTKDLPSGWTAYFPNIIDDRIYLITGEKESVELIVIASGSPFEAMGYEQYDITIICHPEINPLASSEYEQAFNVEPRRLTEVSVLGNSVISGLPGDVAKFDLSVTNRGNLEDTFIPIMQWSGDNDGEDLVYDLSISHTILGLSDTVLFELSIEIPCLPAGELFYFVVNGTDEHSIGAELCLEPENITQIICTASGEQFAPPGDSISYPIRIENTGNIALNLTIKGICLDPNVQIQSGNLQIDMGQELFYGLEITLPDNLLAETVVPVEVKFASAGSTVQNLTIHINITEYHWIDLELLDTQIIADSDFTIYWHTIEVHNAGNCDTTVSFDAAGTHSDHVSLPSPFQMHPFGTDFMFVNTTVPLGFTGLMDNYLIPMDSSGSYGDLNLRIPPYNSNLTTVITESQSIGMFIYDIAVTNHGFRGEHVSLELELPMVDSYPVGVKRWEGTITQDFMDLMPDSNDSFRVIITTPDHRDYWGSDLKVVITATSGKKIQATLSKPPIASMGVDKPTYINFEDVVTFTGSLSYWNIVNYHWDFGNGHTAEGITVDHSFPRSGTFTTTLTVTDENGFSDSVSTVIQVDNQSPIPTITTDPVSGTVEVDVPISFDASWSVDRDGEIIKYTWNIEGISDITWPVAEHIFTKTGTYNVSLQVTDNHGATETIVRIIKVVTPQGSSSGGDDQDDDSVTSTSTDPMTFSPMIGAVLAALAGLVIIARKRSFISMLREQAGEEGNSSKAQSSEKKD